MKGSLREKLEILKSPSVEGQDKAPVLSKSKGTLMDLLGRAQVVTEGRVPKNLMADQDRITKELTEMAVREAPEAPEGSEVPEDKTYFGSTGDRVYYATVEKGEEVEGEAPTIKSIKLFDVGEEEVWSLENEEGLANIEVIYQAVIALSLDSISWAILEDLGVLSMEPEVEEKPEKEEKPEEEKPEEEPKEEQPPVEEPAPEEEEEVEEPVESVKHGDIVTLLMDLAGPSILKAGTRGIVNSVESVDRITVDFKLNETNSLTKIFKLEEMKKATKKIVKKKKVKKVKEALDLNQAPATDPKLKMTGNPAKDPKVNPAGAEGTSDAPVKPKDPAAKEDAGAPDPKLGKDNIAAVVGNEKPLEDKGGAAGKQTAPVSVPKVEGTTVIKETEVPSLEKENVRVCTCGAKEVKQDVGAVEAGQDLNKKDVVLDTAKIVGEGALDVQKPDEYKDAIDKLQKELADGKISQQDFENGKSELDKKFKAEPAGTTESVEEKAAKAAIAEATKSSVWVGDVVKVKDKEGLYIVESFDAATGKVTVTPKGK